MFFSRLFSEGPEKKNLKMLHLHRYGTGLMIIRMKVYNDLSVKWQEFKQKWFIAGDGPDKEELLSSFNKNEFEIKS